MNKPLHGMILTGVGSIAAVILTAFVLGMASYDFYAETVPLIAAAIGAA